MGHMTLLGKPVPPLDHTPHQFGAPPGIAVDFNALKSWDGSSNPWWVSRPTIRPTTAVVHTNGAGGEGSYQSAINWGNAAKNNTKAHYNLNAPTPTKNVPSGRRAIANSTPSAMETEYGVRDSSFWTLAIETADRGSNNGGGTDLGDFLYDHDELLARLLAYESMVWGIPLVVPTDWVNPGVVTHTSPWDGVFTIYKGKSCPGTTKKDRVLRGDILARATEIKIAWTVGTPTPDPTPPTSGDDEMKRSWPNRIDSRNNAHHKTLKAGEERSVWISSSSVGMTDPDVVTINVTAIPRTEDQGWLAVWPGGDFDPDNGQVTTVNFEGSNIASQMTVPVDANGNLMVMSNKPCDFIIDVTGIYW